MISIAKTNVDLNVKKTVNINVVITLLGYITDKERGKHT